MNEVVKLERKCSQCGKRPSDCERYPKGPRTFLCPWQSLKLDGGARRQATPPSAS